MSESNEMYLFSVRDKLAEEFAPLFEAKNDQIALRVVRTMFKKFEDSFQISDFELCCLGHYNHMDGKITAYENPRTISLEEINVK